MEVIVRTNKKESVKRNLKQILTNYFGSGRRPQNFGELLAMRPTGDVYYGVYTSYDTVGWADRPGLTHTCEVVFSLNEVNKDGITNIRVNAQHCGHYEGVAKDILDLIRFSPYTESG